MPGRSKEEGEEVKQKWPSKKKLIVWTVLSNRKRRRRFPVFVLGGVCVRVCECVCVVSSAFFIIVGGCVYEGESTIFGVCTHTHTHRSNPLTHSRKDRYGFSKQQHHQREREKSSSSRAVERIVFNFSCDRSSSLVNHPPGYTSAYMCVPWCVNLPHVLDHRHQQQQPSWAEQASSRMCVCRTCARE